MPEQKNNRENERDSQQVTQHDSALIPTKLKLWRRDSEKKFNIAKEAIDTYLQSLSEIKSSSFLKDPSKWRQNRRKAIETKKAAMELLSEVSKLGNKSAEELLKIIKSRKTEALRQKINSMNQVTNTVESEKQTGDIPIPQPS